MIRLHISEGVGRWKGVYSKGQRGNVSGRETEMTSSASRALWMAILTHPACCNVLSCGWKQTVPAPGCDSGATSGDGILAAPFSLLSLISGDGVAICDPLDVGRMGIGESDDRMCSYSGGAGGVLLIVSGVEKTRVCVSPGASSAFKTTCL